MSIIPSFFGNRRSSVFDPFSLDVWDPFKDLPLSSPSGLSNETSALVNTRVDWKETPEAHVFKADLPGIKKEEVKVEVEDDRVLQITGERKVEKEDKNDKWHRVERSSGKFTRRFRLPENAKMDQVKAAMENGVLTVGVYGRMAHVERITAERPMPNHSNRTTGTERKCCSFPPRMFPA